MTLFVEDASKAYTKEKPMQPTNNYLHNTKYVYKYIGMFKGPQAARGYLITLEAQMPYVFSGHSLLLTIQPRVY